MLTLCVIDKSAEVREKLSLKINSFLQVDRGLYLPQISLQTLALEEISFHAVPDICILYSASLKENIFAAVRVRKQFPKSVILVWLDTEADELELIDELAFTGIDDTVSVECTADEFVRKLILIQGKKRNLNKHGRLIVVASGKGGVGCTTLTAALGEGLAANNFSTLLFDGDYETQDLSRFLQVRPFINENLQELFNKNRPVTKENLEECISRVWEDEDNLSCLTPLLENDALYDEKSEYPKILISILEVLDNLYDFIIVDLAAFKGSLKRTFLKLADELVFVINNDPAALYAGVSIFNKYKTLISADTSITVVENGSNRKGLTSEFLSNEFKINLKEGNALYNIPFSNLGIKWIASGGTLYSRANNVRQLKNLIEHLIPEDLKETKSNLLPALNTLIRRNTYNVKSPVKPKQIEDKMIALPEPIEIKSLSVNQKNNLVSGVKFIS